MRNVRKLLGSPPFLPLFLNLRNLRMALTHTQQARVAQLAMCGPLNKPNQHDDLRPYPMCTQARQSNSFRKRRLPYLETIQSGTQLEQQLRVKASSNLPCKHELVAFVMSNEKRTETDAFALRICESTNDELLRHLALHFQPMFRTALFINRIASLSDDTFPTFLQRSLPRQRIRQRLNALEWFR